MPILPGHKDVRDFISYLRLKNLSQRTIADYQRMLRNFFRSCSPEVGTPGDVTFEHLRDYIAGRQAHSLAAKTICENVKVLKQFFGYLYTNGCIASDPAKRLPVPKVGMRLPRALTLEETASFLSALSGNSRPERRDRVLFYLMYAGGFRVGEVVRIRVKDIDFAESSVRVVGKGDKERRIYLKPNILQMLSGYIESEGLKEEDFVFRGQKDGPITHGNVQVRIKRYAKAAGITRRVTPHTLRHSIAVHYLQGGAPVNFVQSLLGHASLATTGWYLHLTDQMARQIALNTETAFDSSASSQKESKIRELHQQYHQDSEFELWESYVADVLEWLK